MYRPRNPRASPLFQLFETHYETVKSVWEERFERQYGFWQGRWDRAVAAYQDCGLFGRTLTPSDIRWEQRCAALPGGSIPM